MREIITVPELIPSVMGGPLCMGRINFRGHPVAVVDFSALLHCAGASGAAPAERRILVALVGETLIGLLVDSVDSIFHVADGDVMPIPLLSRARAGMFTGCISRDEGDLLLLNHEAIFSQAELLEIGVGHVRLYQAEASAAGAPAAGVRGARGRAVYVVFALDTSWAVDIGQLREILPWRAGMVRPPGLPNCVHGILNLRHQMISVIDLRCLLGMAPAPARDDCKIMIVERGSERFGLIVDAVENIVTVAAGARRASPRLLAGDGGAPGRVKEVIDIRCADGSGGTLNVFDPEVLFALMEQAMH